MIRRIVETRNEDDTDRVARELAPDLTTGTVILLHGDLGAGKTAFVRGLAAGLGLDPEEVSSPTFTLVQEYRGAVPLFHADLYRLAEREVPDLGLEELSHTGIVAVEWAEKWARPGGRVIEVHIDDLGGDRRRITIEGGDEPSR